MKSEKVPHNNAHAPDRLRVAHGAVGWANFDDLTIS
jgi:hypothetical protein